MAKVVASFPARKGRRMSYFDPSWVKYLDGEIWCLKKGEDYTCSTHTIKRWLYLICEREEKYLKAYVTKEDGEEYLYVQCMDEPELKPVRKPRRRRKQSVDSEETKKSTTQATFDLGDKNVEEEELEAEWQDA
ncbi:MAG: hypothetical protein KatS3mg087_1021 [Patescibacteria group bacterium]|nr:MAG: hypothetical protein KatS3mg087_1021 [Patescibacteria group bacterium]